MELPVAAARLALGTLDPQDAIDTAHEVLRCGVYADALVSVIGMEPRGWEVRTFDVLAAFERALAELGVAVPGRVGAVEQLVGRWAGRSAGGRVSPPEGVAALLREVGPAYLDWPELVSLRSLELEWERDPWSRPVIAGEIARVARSWLAEPSHAEPGAAADGGSR